MYGVRAFDALLDAQLLLRLLVTYYTSPHRCQEPSRASSLDWSLPDYGPSQRSCCPGWQLDYLLQRHCHASVAYVEAGLGSGLNAAAEHFDIFTLQWADKHQDICHAHTNSNKGSC